MQKSVIIGILILVLILVFASLSFSKIPCKLFQVNCDSNLQGSLATYRGTVTEGILVYWDFEQQLLDDSIQGVPLEIIRGEPTSVSYFLDPTTDTNSLVITPDLSFIINNSYLGGIDSEITISFVGTYIDGIFLSKQNNIDNSEFLIGGDSSIISFSVDSTQPGVQCSGAFETQNHIVFTAKSNGDQKIYLNGVPCDNKILGPFSFNGDEHLLLGGLSGFDGTLNELTIWDRELSEEEILEDLIHLSGESYDLKVQILITKENHEIGELIQLE